MGANLKNQHMKIWSDNKAAVATIRNTSSRSKALMPYIRETYWIGMEHNIMLSSSHIAGKLNILADRISRLATLKDAFDARLLLAGFSGGLVQCKNHMSIRAFYFLQGAWTPISGG